MRPTSPQTTPALELLAAGPMLLEEVSPRLAPTGNEWTAEIKYDGYRLFALVAEGRLMLRTRGRNGNPADATRWYPELRGLTSLPSETVLDGEVAVLDDIGRSDFESLHARSRRRKLSPGDRPVAYCAFDLLMLGGKDLRAWPLKRRKEALAELLSPPPDHVLFVQDLPGQVAALYSAALQLQLEGVVAKRLDSAYQSGARSLDWVKVKRPGAVPPERFRR